MNEIVYYCDDHPVEPQTVDISTPLLGRID